MRTTDELRAIWGPRCLPRQDAAEIWYDGRKFLVHPQTVDAWDALFDVMARWGYRIGVGTLDDWSLVCRAITGGKKLSLHSFGIAVDINSITNPYGRRLVTDMPAGMVAEIKGLRTNGGHQVFRWGGDYAGNKDAMHYEVVASPAELRLGIRGASAHPPLPPAYPGQLIGYIAQELLL